MKTVSQTNDCQGQGQVNVVKEPIYLPFDQVVLRNDTRERIRVSCILDGVEVGFFRTNPGIQFQDDKTLTIDGMQGTIRQRDGYEREHMEYRKRQKGYE